MKIKKDESISPEKAMKQVQKIFKERGTKALEIARKEILQEKIESKEAREALRYFMTQYWHDLARPSLLSLVCEAVGGNPELTTPISIPMIMISGALDIHDDIIDKSKTKYSRRTVYGKYGGDVALLVGDALLFKGLTLLNRAVERGISVEKLTLIMDLIKNMFFELGDAEASELPLRGRLDVLPKHYLNIVRKKAADVEAHTRIGAVLGEGSKREIEALGRYGRLLGMLIILRDDWIDVIDFEESLHRIKNECLPLPLLYAGQNSNVKHRINSLVKKQKMRRENADAILEITYKSGGIQLLRKLMIELMRKASSELKEIKYNKEQLELLLQATIAEEQPT